MRKIVYLLLILLLVSCGKDKKINTPILITNTGSNITNTIDDDKIVQIKELLKSEKDLNLIIETGSQNEVPKAITPKKTNGISPIIHSTENYTETGVLTEEEINIIENTTDGEIDELIDILFKDLN